MSQPDPKTTITEHIIGKINYHIFATSSDNATDTLDKKLNKLIIKNANQINSQKYN